MTVDHYARVYDAVRDALDVESLASVEDAVNDAIEAWQDDNDATDQLQSADKPA